MLANVEINVQWDGVLSRRGIIGEFRLTDVSSHRPAWCWPMFLIIWIYGLLCSTDPSEFVFPWQKSRQLTSNIHRYKVQSFIGKRWHVFNLKQSMYVISTITILLIIHIPLIKWVCNSQELQLHHNIMGKIRRWQSP